MPRRRDEKSAAPSPSPRLSRRRAEEAVEIAGDRASVAPAVESVEEGEEHGEHAEVEENGEGEGEQENGEGEGEQENGEGEENGEENAEEEEVEKKKPTLEERQAKLKELRMRMNQSSADNRRDLIADHQKSKVTAKELQRLEKQRKLAQTLRLKADAEENGEDLERRNAWKWSIEQNEQWEAKVADGKERSDGSFHNAEHAAHRRYAKNIRGTKVDLVAYNRQKEAALGLEPGTLVPLGATSAEVAAAGPSAAGLSATENLYRTKDTLSYGDSKPSEDAIDRVVGKINADMTQKRKKKKSDEGEEVNYINHRNRMFNKKASRYFDKYTTEIRANLERGTAL